MLILDLHRPFFVLTPPFNVLNPSRMITIKIGYELQFLLLYPTFTYIDTNTHKYLYIPYYNLRQIIPQSTLNHQQTLPTSSNWRSDRGTFNFSTVSFILSLAKNEEFGNYCNILRVCPSGLRSSTQVRVYSYARVRWVCHSFILSLHIFLPALSTESRSPYFFFARLDNTLKLRFP